MRLTITVFPYLLLIMKTTVDLPPSLLERSKVYAARNRTTLKRLVEEGLERVISDKPEDQQSPLAALERIKHGYHLGGKPLDRDQTHAR